MQLDVKKLKEQYGDNVQKCARLEDELERCQKRVKFLENLQGAKRDEYTEGIVTELASVKAQLTHKTQLLDKVKMLLQKAASKEKALQDQVRNGKMHFFYTFYKYHILSRHVILLCYSFIKPTPSFVR